MKKLIPFLTLVVATTAQSQTLFDFESPTYSTGNLTTGPTSVTSGATFTGLNGWSQSGSGGPGAIVTTTSSGLYTGGQALGSGNSGNAYIGVNNNFALGNSFYFDLLAPVANKGGVSGFADLNSDSAVTYSSENGIFAGALDSGGSSRFAFRDLAIGGSSYGSGVAANTTDWYRIYVTLDDSTWTATMNVINLTLGGTVVDLDPSTSATSFSHSWADGSVWIPTTSWTGTGARASGTILIDNITSTVPEPSAIAMLLVGGVGLLIHSRRQKD
jgi:hypothetical protein